MKNEARATVKRAVLFLLLVSTLHSPLSSALAQPALMSYQGRLFDGTNLANGSYDFTFTYFLPPTGGSPLFGPVTNSAVSVSNGLFTTYINVTGINPSLFSGGVAAAHYLEVAARTNGSGGAFSALTPRQPVTTAPSAFYATSAATAGTATTANTANGVAANAVTAGGIASGQVVKSLNGLEDAVTLAQGPNVTITTNGNTLTIASTAGGGGGSGWSLTGNAGTTPGVNYAGTSDDEPLQLHVNSQRALRLEPDNTGNSSPNVIGGSQNNSASGVIGATISGGGSSSAANTVSANYGTVAGGAGNRVTNFFGSVGGGGTNASLGQFATVGGGQLNASVYDYATVGGGRQNTAGYFYVTIGGGNHNVANGEFATVAGGDASSANGDHSTVGGGNGNVASGDYAAVSGGIQNTASGPGSFVGGGGYDGAFFSPADRNLATSGASVVAGGVANSATNLYSAIGGGRQNIAGGESAVVGGGDGNTATGQDSTVPGGSGNVATGMFSFAAGAGSQATNDECFVWSDGSAATASTAAGQFVARAGGGFYFYTGGGSGGAWLPAGQTAWITLSDRNAKKNIAPVDYEDVLDRLARVPIEQWNYKWERDDQTPNLGPMAQDFIHAFYPGRDDKGISTLEFDGVELAAIKGLNQKLDESVRLLQEELARRELENEALQQKFAEKNAQLWQLQQAVAELKATLQTLEAHN
jgi:hypothetical protein